MKSNEEIIESLEKRISDLWDEINVCRNEITRLNLSGLNFEGKYIHYDNYGYMYVTWEHFDQIEGLNTSIFFQGVFFNGEWGAYRDSSWAEFEMIKEWNISYEMFKKDVENGNVKVITKDEFIKAYEDLIERTQQNFKKKLDLAEDQYINSTKSNT